MTVEVEVDMPSPQMRPERSAIWMTSLDGLRAVSILMVLTAHVYTPGWIDLGGHFGVTAFFVLSGFLITELMLREQQRAGHVDLAAFYIRRVFRLFPAYYVVLAVYCVLLLGLHLRHDLEPAFRTSLPWYLAYLQEVPFFRGSTHVQPFGQAWSLGIEEKFYLVWPILGFVVIGSMRGRVLLAATGFFALSIAPTLSPYGRYVYPYAAIFLGCTVALIHDDPAIATRLAWLQRGVGAAIAASSWVAIHVVATGATGPTAWLAERAYPVTIAGVLLASLGTNWLHAVLSTRMLRLLGELSYGIYLVHTLVRSVIDAVLGRLGVTHPPGILIYGGMLVGSVFTAWVLHKLVEGPARQFGRDLADRLRA